MKMPEYVVVKIMPDKKGTSYSLEVVADTDFVNVVRCKDCVYYQGINKWCDYDLRTVDEGYCFFGKRREVTE